MINSDRGINPVAMTVMSGFNIGEAGGSNQRPPVVKSCTLPTELRGSTNKIGQKYTATAQTAP